MHATDIAVPGAVAMSQLKIGSCECEIVRGTALDSNRSAKSRGLRTSHGSLFYKLTRQPSSASLSLHDPTCLIYVVYNNNWPRSSMYPLVRLFLYPGPAGPRASVDAARRGAG